MLTRMTFIRDDHPQIVTTITNEMGDATWDISATMETSIVVEGTNVAALNVSVMYELVVEDELRQDMVHFVFYRNPANIEQLHHQYRC